MSTILIESGGYPHDVEKQYIRRLNFHVLMVAFEAIASKSYTAEPVEAYKAIPENSRFLYDLVIRNVRIARDGQEYTGHLGINRAQVKKADYRGVYFRGSIDEIGDMDRQFGYDEHDAGLLRFMPAKVKVMTKKAWEALRYADELALIKEGFLFVKWSDERPASGALYGRLLNLTGNEGVAPQVPAPGQHANFLLARNNVPVFAVVNGFLLDLSKPPESIANTIGY
jgi:hypothetical protein